MYHPPQSYRLFFIFHVKIYRALYDPRLAYLSTKHIAQCNWGAQRDSISKPAREAIMYFLLEEKEVESGEQRFLSGLLSSRFLTLGIGEKNNPVWLNWRGKDLLPSKVCCDVRQKAFSLGSIARWPFPDFFVVIWDYNSGNLWNTSKSDTHPFHIRPPSHPHPPYVIFLHLVAS